MATDTRVAPSTRPSTSPVRHLLLGCGAGALSGAVVGGAGGRLAMRVLAATSPGARGARTDDAATVGVISLEGTLFLLLLCSALGAVSGLVYLTVRHVLPARPAARVGLFGGASGVVGGALLVHDHASFDYSVLRPEWLAVAMFVLVPAASGAVTAALVERWLGGRPGGGRLPWWQVVLGVAGVVLLLPAVGAGGPAGGTVLLAALVLGMTPPLRRLWRTRPMTVVVGVGMALAVAWGLYDLVTDIVSIATDRPSTAPFTV